MGLVAVSEGHVLVVVPRQIGRTVQSADERGQMGWQRRERRLGWLLSHEFRVQNVDLLTR
jgi:hypothetical protein